MCLYRLRDKEEYTEASKFIVERFKADYEEAILTVLLVITCGGIR